MVDQTQQDHDIANLLTVPSLVTFWLLGIWTLMIGGVFFLAALRVPIEGVMLGVLSGVIGTQTTLLVAAVSYWVGSTQGAKNAQERAANDNKEAQKVIAQLAGAGPPPPAPANPTAAQEEAS